MIYPLLLLSVLAATAISSATTVEFIVDYNGCSTYCENIANLHVTLMKQNAFASASVLGRSNAPLKIQNVRKFLAGSYENLFDEVRVKYASNPRASPNPLFLIVTSYSRAALAWNMLHSLRGPIFIFALYDLPNELPFYFGALKVHHFTSDVGEDVSVTKKFNYFQIYNTHFKREHLFMDARILERVSFFTFMGRENNVIQPASSPVLFFDSFVLDSSAVSRIDESLLVSYAFVHDFTASVIHSEQGASVKVAKMEEAVKKARKIYSSKTNVAFALADIFNQYLLATETIFFNSISHSVFVTDTERILSILLSYFDASNVPFLGSKKEITIFIEDNISLLQLSLMQLKMESYTIDGYLVAKAVFDNLDFMLVHRGDKKFPSLEKIFDLRVKLAEFKTGTPQNNVQFESASISALFSQLLGSGYNLEMRGAELITETVKESEVEKEKENLSSNNEKKKKKKKKKSKKNKKSLQLNAAAESADDGKEESPSDSEDENDESAEKMTELQKSIVCLNMEDNATSAVTECSKEVTEIKNENVKVEEKLTVEIETETNKLPDSKDWKIVQQKSKKNKSAKKKGNLVHLLQAKQKPTTELANEENQVIVSNPVEVTKEQLKVTVNEQVNEIDDSRVREELKVQPIHEDHVETLVSTELVQESVLVGDSAQETVLVDGSAQETVPVQDSAVNEIYEQEFQSNPELQFIPMNTYVPVAQPVVYNTAPQIIEHYHYHIVNNNPIELSSQPSQPYTIDGTTYYPQTNYPQTFTPMMTNYPQSFYPMAMNYPYPQSFYPMNMNYQQSFYPMNMNSQANVAGHFPNNNGLYFQSSSMPTKMPEQNDEGYYQV